MNSAQASSEVLDLLETLGKRHRAHAMQALDEFDLTFPLAGALHELERPCPMSVLAERLACDASYITGIADRLEERGLAERRPDPDDRRVKQLMLTDAGRSLHDELRASIRSRHPILEHLDEEDRRQLAVLLRKALGDDRPS